MVSTENFVDNIRLEDRMETRAARGEWDKPGSLHPARYTAGQRVMVRTDRWGWVVATIQWCSDTHAATITEGDKPYLLTVPMEDVRPCKDPDQQ